MVPNRTKGFMFHFIEPEDEGDQWYLIKIISNTNFYVFIHGDCIQENHGMSWNFTFDLKILEYSND